MIQPKRRYSSWLDDKYRWCISIFIESNIEWEGIMIFPPKEGIEIRIIKIN